MEKMAYERVDELISQMAPKSLAEVIGQPELVAALRELVATSQRRDHPLPAILIVGPAWSGKSAIASGLVSELVGQPSGSVDAVDADGIDSAEAMRAVLQELTDRAVLQLRDIDRLPTAAYAVLAEAVAEFQVRSGSFDNAGPEAHALELPLFSAIATAQAEKAIGEPSPEVLAMQEWITLRVVPYEQRALVAIAHGSADRIGAEITGQAADELAGRAGGLPGRVQQVIAAIVASHTSSQRPVVIDRRLMRRFLPSQ